MKKLFVALLSLMVLAASSYAREDGTSPNYMKYDTCATVYGGTGRCEARANGYFSDLGYKGTLYDKEFKFLGDKGYKGTIYDRWSKYLGDLGYSGTIRDRFYAARAVISMTFWAPFDNPADPLKLNRGTGTLSFTRATTATYVHPTTGLITTAAANVLRIEANGALIEGARTNLALQSEALGLAANWVASNVTVDNNTAVAPCGATTAETLTAGADNATLLQSYTGTAVAYTGSYYLKRKTGAGAVQVSADNTTWTSCTINDTTWTRCTDTRTVTAATYYHGIRLATNTDAVYAWGGDAELGAFASSYIGPTTTAAVTRNQDALRISSTGNLVALSPYSLYAQVDVIGESGDGVIIGSDVAYAPYWSLQSSSDVTKFYNNSGNTFASSVEIDGEYGTPKGRGVVFDGTNLHAYRAGIKGTSAGKGTPVAEISEIRMGYTSTNPLFGHIKNLRIWNRALSDAEMIAITQ